MFNCRRSNLPTEKKIQWHVQTLQAITLRLGGFHRAKKLISVIGKRMKLTGLKEILEASQMYRSAQVEGNTKIGVLKFAVKTLEKCLRRYKF